MACGPLSQGQGALGARRQSGLQGPFRLLPAPGLDPGSLQGLTLHAGGPVTGP